MAILKIARMGHPVLGRVAAPIEDPDTAEVHRLVADMLETMEGLAANSAGTITDDKIIDGVNYVFQKASQMGRPAVVLLAVSKITGPHDGNDPLDIALDALAGPGKLIVAAAGNYGGLNLHGD